VKRVTCDRPAGLPPFVAGSKSESPAKEGHSLPGRARIKSGYVRFAAESEVVSDRLDAIALDDPFATCAIWPPTQHAGIIAGSSKPKKVAA
jgi:hypothetical protein